MSCMSLISTLLHYHSPSPMPTTQALPSSRYLTTDQASILHVLQNWKKTMEPRGGGVKSALGSLMSMVCNVGRYAIG
jgi:hypothetical protein